MRWKIYVENQLVDCPRNLSAEFTYTIDDIRDFGARNTNFSKTIILPGTPTNRRVFGHVFEFGSANLTSDNNPNVGYDYNAAKSAKCLVTQDGLPIFKGVIRILEIRIDRGAVEFETAVFGELGGLVAELADKRLEDIDFSAYNHAFTIENIVSSWTRPAGTGVHYPHADYGISQDRVDFPITAFRPALHVREYVDRIITGAGYTYTSNFLNSNFFRKVIIPFNEDKVRLDVEMPVWCTLNSAEVQPQSITQLYWSSTYAAYGFRFHENHKIQYWRDEAVKPFVRVRADFRIRESWITQAPAFVNFKRTQWPNVELVHWTQVNLVQNTGSFEVDVAIEWRPGDEYFIELGNSHEEATIDFANIRVELHGNPTVKIPLGEGDFYPVNSTIPKGILQRDLLSSIVKMFNLYVDEEEGRHKHLNIEPFVSYYKGAGVKNWSSKLDRRSPIRLKPLSEINARRYEYKYREDGDYWNDFYKKKYGEVYGTRVHDTGIDYVKDKETVEVIFSATPLVGYRGQDRVYSAIYKRDGTTDKPTESNIRILNRVESPLPCVTWNIVRTDGTKVPFNSYAYAGHLDNPDNPHYDLNWGAPKEVYFAISLAFLSNNLFNVWWSWYMGEISDKDSKLLTAMFRLTAEDINSLDFAELIFIDGMLWRLVKVKDYNMSGEKLTECELLKVIDRQ